RPEARAVIIGVNKYQDDKISNLSFARADAEGVYRLLTDPELGRIFPENVILLLDEEATQRNIRSAIGTKLPRQAGENDLVYIYYAGHGSPVIDPQSRSRDGIEKYLVPSDADLDDLFATAISMNEIQTFDSKNKFGENSHAQKSPARRYQQIPQISVVWMC
ncbi:MAG: caspase family protein, partial [bacterium]